jgi:hypothetical protein
LRACLEKGTCDCTTERAGAAGDEDQLSLEAHLSADDDSLSITLATM